MCNYNLEQFHQRKRLLWAHGPHGRYGWISPILHLFSYFCPDSDSNTDSVNYVWYDTIGYRHHKYTIWVFGYRYAIGCWIFRLGYGHTWISLNGFDLEYGRKIFVWFSSIVVNRCWQAGSRLVTNTSSPTLPRQIAHSSKVGCCPAHGSSHMGPSSHWSCRARFLALGTRRKAVSATPRRKTTSAMETSACFPLTHGREHE